MLLTVNLCQCLNADNRPADSPPFVIQGTLPAGFQKKIRETAHQAFQDGTVLLGCRLPETTSPLTLEITLYDANSGFLSLFRKRNRQPQGILYDAENRACLRLSADFDQRSQEVIRHEIAHWLLRRLLKPAFPENNNRKFFLPRWLDEGIACVLEMPLDDDGQAQLHPARCRQFLELAKRRKSEVRFNRILLPADNKRRLSSDEYAYSWALVFYLSRQYSANNNSALQNLLQGSLQNKQTPDWEQWYYHQLIKLVKASIHSPADLLRQLQAYLENGQLAQVP